MSYTFADGKGPRWIGDSLPDLPPSLLYAQNLPPKITSKYVLFFGYDRPEPECCLQQWYPSPFTSTSTSPTSSSPGEKKNIISFHTAEQYMMYHKALLMHDTEIAAQVLAADTPAKAKALGRAVKIFKQEVWDRECDGVVEEGNWLKFSQSGELGRVLLGTGERRLVETSPNDRVWGVGFNSEEAVGRESEWGENKLGKALERVRERLRGKSGGGKK